MEAVHEASLGEKTTVAVDGPLTLTSATYNAGVKSGAKVEARDATISALREAKVGKNMTLTLSGDLAITATGDTSESHTVVDTGAAVIVAGSMALISGNKATLGKNATVTVATDLHMRRSSVRSWISNGDRRIYVRQLSLDTHPADAHPAGMALRLEDRHNLEA